MMSIRSAVVAIALLVGCASCSSTPPASSADSRTSAERAEARSVAIVSGGKAHCGGVWLSKSLILTAAHCVQTENEAQKVLEALGVEVHQPSLIGSEADYAVKEGLRNGVSHSAKVMAADTDVDLALLMADIPPEHEYARVSQREDIHDGEELDVVGSTAGLAFTYSRCYVGAQRKDYLQVSGPVFLGNSGGGAFDDRGELVGIAHHMIGSEDVLVPSVSFFVPARAIRKFLEAAAK